MGEILISKKQVSKNKLVKRVQKEYLKEHRKIKGRYPKAKLGKVLKVSSHIVLDCTNNQQENWASQENLSRVEALSSEEMLKRIEKNNLQGLSGSAFPEIKKILAIKDSKVSEKVLIVNAVACDPGLLHDAWILKEKQKEISLGIKCIKKCTGISKVIIASPESVPPKYPMGAERILIKNFLGIELTKDEIPANKGILVMNVQTIYALAEMISCDRPQSTRYLTLGDLDSGEGIVIKADISETVGDILEKADRQPRSHQKIYVGMGTMDADEANLSTLVTIQTNMITVGENIAEYADDARCRRCGACISKCPMGIPVAKIIEESKKGELCDDSKAMLSNCISCGTCSYFCRAGKNTMRILNQLKEKYSL